MSSPVTPGTSTPSGKPSINRRPAFAPQAFPRPCRIIPHQFEGTQGFCVSAVLWARPSDLPTPGNAGTFPHPTWRNISTATASLTSPRNSGGRPFGRLPSLRDIPYPAMSRAGSPQLLGGLGKPASGVVEGQTPPGPAGTLPPSRQGRSPRLGPGIAAEPRHREQENLSNFRGGDYSLFDIRFFRTVIMAEILLHKGNYRL